MQLGAKLRKTRQSMGYTQTQVADQIKMAPVTDSWWETGRRPPSVDMVYKLAAVLNVPVAFLLDEEEDKVKTSAHELTDPEWEMLQKYRAVDPFGRQAVDAVMAVELARCRQGDKSSKEQQDAGASEE